MSTEMKSPQKSFKISIDALVNHEPPPSRIPPLSSTPPLLGNSGNLNSTAGNISPLSLLPYSSHSNRNGSHSPGENRGACNSTQSSPNNSPTERHYPKILPSHSPIPATSTQNYPFLINRNTYDTHSSSQNSHNRFTGSYLTSHQVNDSETSTRIPYDRMDIDKGQRREKRKNFKCSYSGCQQAFTCRNHLERHLRMHTGEKPYACIFPGCPSRFSRHDNMLQHFKVHKRKKDELAESLNNGDQSLSPNQEQEFIENIPGI